MTRRWASALAHQVGRRGTFLLFLALLDLIYGASLLVPTPRSLSTPTTAFLLLVAPLQVWACLWLAVGAVCLVYAFRREDRVGYAAAMFLKGLWGSLFLLGWLFAGVERGYLSAAVWLAFVGVLGIIATWPDESKSAVARGE